MKFPFPMLFGMLAVAGLVAADTKLVASPSPHARLPIERWDGIQVDFPYPIYLADEQFNYNITVTNTTANAFPLKDGRIFDGTQLVWIPYRDGREIEFSGSTAFGDEGGSFERSPLEVAGPDLRNWSLILQNREVLQPGQSKEFLTSNGGMWLDTQPHPDSLVPYLLTTDRLLVGPRFAIRVDSRRVGDFPVVTWEGEAHSTTRDFREVELEGERFLFLGKNGNYRLCRIPRGLQYNVRLSLDEIPATKGGAWVRQTLTVSFPGSNEPDFVGMLQVPQTIHGTAQTDPKLWAKSLPKAANQPAAVVEPVVETTGKDSRAAGPATTGNPSLWPWIGLAVGCIALLASAVFLIRRKG
jgi:hypothetical protein